MLVISSVFSENIALFATVTDVKKNDTLNIRNRPSYTSKKVGSLPFEALITIDKYQTKKNATWCKVYQISQQFYENSMLVGSMRGILRFLIMDM